MSICSTAPPEVVPLVVKPRDARRMLNCGQTRLYELLGTGELESFLDGRSRKITVESIHRYISRRLGSSIAPNQSLRGGRSRKTNDGGGATP